MSEDTTNERGLGRVEGQLTVVLSTLSRIETSFNNRLTAVENRTTKVENKQYWFAGAVGVLVFVANKIDFMSFLPR